MNLDRYRIETVPEADARLEEERNDLRDGSDGFLACHFAHLRAGSQGNVSSAHGVTQLPLLICDKTRNKLYIAPDKKWFPTVSFP